MYATEWTWDRTEEQQQLATAEILSLVKAGQLTPALAARLDNLGWSDPDAVLLLAEVQHELLTTAQKLQPRRPRPTRPSREGCRNSCGSGD